MTSLFYVRDDSELEWNRDLFVVANNCQEVLSLWREHYEMDADDEPVCIYSIPFIIGDERPQVLDWNDLDGVMISWKSKKTQSAI